MSKKSPLQTNRFRWLPRQGSTVSELLVAATLLVTLIGTVGPFAVQAGRLWQETRHQHLALDELSNQLERATHLPAAELAEFLTQLAPSETAVATLPEVSLSAELLDDQDGKRVAMSIQWKRRHQAPPITLVAWVLPTQPIDSKNTSAQVGATP